MHNMYTLPFSMTIALEDAVATCVHCTTPAVNVPLAPITPGKTLMYMFAQLI